MYVYRELTTEEKHLLKKYAKEHCKSDVVHLEELIRTGDASIFPTRATSWAGVAKSLTYQTGYKWTAEEAKEGDGDGIEWGNGYIVERCL